jgi:hypothetical protein
MFVHAVLSFVVFVCACAYMQTEMHVQDLCIEAAFSKFLLR